MTDLTEKKTSTGSRFLKIATGSIVGLIVLLGGFVSLAYFDPFGWHVFGRLDGEYDAALVAIPTDAIGYMGINFLETNITRGQEIFDAFNEAIKEANNEDTEAEAQKFLLEELGIQKEDVTAWLGQYAGLGLLELTTDGSGELQSAEWVAAVESLDNAAADAFLAKLQTGLTQKWDAAPTTESYQGFTLTVFANDDVAKRVAFTRSGNLVLIGSTPTTLKRAIDTQNGESLATSAEYTAVTDQLPANRMITVYLNGAKWIDIFQQMSNQMGLVGTSGQDLASLNGFQNIGLSVLLNDSGIQVDTSMTYDAAQMSEFQKQILANNSNLTTQTASLFPADTILYTSGRSLNLLWPGMKEQLLKQEDMTADDLDEAMKSFADQFGFNPETDLFNYLDGEYGIALVPSSDSVIATLGQVDLGMAAAFQTSQEEKLAQTMQTFSGKLADPQMGFGTIAERQSTAALLYDVISPSDQTTMFSFGTGSGYLLLGTSGELLEGLHFDGANSLATSSGYQTATKAFANGTQPTFYVDVQSLLTQIRNSPINNASDATEFEQTTAVLRPLQAIAVINQTSESPSHSTLIFFINTK